MKVAPENGAVAHIVAPPECTGCSLCANSCPHDAVAMEWNVEGFLRPVVRSEACVGCSLCVRVCPALKEPEPEAPRNHEKVRAYGAWNKDLEVRRESSSGGIFTALARRTIEAGGCVFGVVWEDTLTAAFAKAESMEEVAAMRGSKYVGARVGTAYREVKEELRRGRIVLFSGTPCQVHALRSYLRKTYDNLLTVDIACHGVPSRILLEKYVREAEQRRGSALARLTFRDKKHSWRTYNLSLRYVNGSAETHYLGEDDYLALFLGDLALNRCCYSCRYCTFPRVGDVTLADFWGVKSAHPRWPQRWGISAVLANTAAGQTALSAIQSQAELKEIPFDEIERGQPKTFQRRTGGIPAQRAELLSEIKTHTLPQLVRKYSRRRKIGPFFINTEGTLGRLLKRVKRYLAWCSGY